MRTKASISIPSGIKQVFSCDMLEQQETELPVADNRFTFTIKPYEILTFLVR
jgi:alpha-mannosidase